MTDDELLLLATNALLTMTKHRDMHKTLAAQCAQSGAHLGTTMERAKAMALDEALHDFKPFIVAIHGRQVSR